MKDFFTLDREFDRLYENGRLIEAIELSKEHLNDYPEYKYVIYGNIIFTFRNLEDWDGCAEYLYKALGEGYFFNFSWPGWDAFKAHKDYQEIERQTEILYNQAVKTASPEYMVKLPDSSTGSEKYPLLILLHGDGLGCNIDFFRHQWCSDRVTERGWITAYLQSSQLNSYKGFGWTGDFKQSRLEIESFIQKIESEYSVDTDRIVLAGFSGGAMASLNFVCNSKVRIHGVLALCPNETEGAGPEDFKAIESSGSAIAVLEGELSGTVDYQNEIVSAFKQLNIRHRYEIIEGIGHSVPGDIESRTEAVLEFFDSEG